jgi:histidine triad (HIT) family protein
MSEDCVFCKIGGGEIESDILYRDESCFVIRDIAPVAPVHLLVIPNEHFTFLADLETEFYPVLGDMFKAASRLAREQGVSDAGYRLVINQGEHAGQAVDHLHLHVLGGEVLEGMG